MKKLTVLLQLCLLVSISNFAQVGSKHADVQLGELTKDSEGSYISDILHTSDTEILVLRTEIKGALKKKCRYEKLESEKHSNVLREDFFLEKYDMDMNLIQSVPLDLNSNNKKLGFESIIYLNNEIQVFTYFINKSKKKRFLFHQSFDPQSLKASSELTKIADISYAKWFNAYGGKFRMKTSEDGSKILFFSHLIHRNISSEKFAFFVFDNKLNPLYNVKEKDDFMFDTKLLEYEDFYIENDGTVHISIKDYKTKNSLEIEDKPKYKYSILSYKPNQNQYIRNDIEFNNKFIIDLKLAMDDNDQLFGAGYYSKRGDRNVRGCYTLNFDKETIKVSSAKFVAFDYQFISSDISAEDLEYIESQLERNDTLELNICKLNQIIPRDNGGYTLIGEETSCYSRVYDYQSVKFYNTSTDIHRHNIIITKLDENGKIENNFKIQKLQQTHYDAGIWSSYAVTHFGEKYYFVFNDSHLNYNAEAGSLLQVMEVNSETPLVLATIDEYGNQTRELIYDTESIDVVSCPTISTFLSSRELLLTGQYEKLNRMTILTFK